MTELLLHGKTVPTAFHLLGKRENDLTYSRGWALAQSPAFLSSFINATLRIRPNLDNVMLRLQQREGTQGITDIEIESSGEFFLVVEANRGWTLPSRAQLETQLTLSSGASGEFPMGHLEERPTWQIPAADPVRFRVVVFRTLLKGAGSQLSKRFSVGLTKRSAILQGT